jgi:hypothetical protein
MREEYGVSCSIKAVSCKAMKMVKIKVIEAHPVMHVNLSQRKNTSSYVLTTIF